MHKTAHEFKKCLKDGGATHMSGKIYFCNRKTEECSLKANFGMGSIFCGTPLGETIRKEAKARAEG